MLRQTFEDELQRLQDEVLMLGSMVEDALTDSVECLRKRDMERSRQLIDRG
jgi:phosphate transport system protein